MIRSTIFIFFVSLSFSAMAIESMTLSEEIYASVPFSSQYIEDGALIRNVDYSAVNELVPQLEKFYGIQLEDRGEAHITVLTPPEAQGWFTDHKGINFYLSAAEIQKKYFENLQKKSFKVVCVGSRQNDEKRVFYLVVETPELLAVRKEIQKEYERRAAFTGSPTSFDAEAFWPHITIGYVGGDVHGVSKGPKTCVKDFKFQIK